jgi:hypothetical protein
MVCQPKKAEHPECRARIGEVRAAAIGGNGRVEGSSVFSPWLLLSIVPVVLLNTTSKLREPPAIVGIVRES